MKKKFTLIVLCLVLSQQIYSQQTESQDERKTTFGVKLGYNSTNYVSAALNSVPYGGFFAETRLNNNWHLQNGILFSYDGITYLEVPVLLKYKVTDSFGVVFGPRLDFNLSKENEMTPQVTYNLLLPSIEGGFQFDITNRLFMETKISYTIIRPFENNSPHYTPPHRSNVRFGVGYRF